MNTPVPSDESRPPKDQKPPSKAQKQAQAAYHWWRALQPTDIEGQRLPGDRAALARLRRCATPFEAVAEPATINLYQKLGCENPTPDLGRVAALAAVLAHVREHNGKDKVARAIGPPPGGEPSEAKVKPVRLRRLLAARSDDELLIAFRRVVALLDRTANVRDLARLLLAWNDTPHGDLTRTNFAFDYYNAGDAAPALDIANATPSNADDTQKE